MTHTLHLDFETRSTVDLRKAGLYVYAAHPSTEVLLACWALDDGPVNTWFRGTRPPPELILALLDPDCRVAAHNAAFERLMIRDVLNPKGIWPIVPIERWDCTAARAARMALPRSLEGVGQALGLAIQKDKEGHRLMLRMCKPLDHTESGEPIFDNDPNNMKRLAAYCAVDVEVERLVDQAVKPLSLFLKEVYVLTEKVNDRGVAMDLGFIDDALEQSERERLRLDAQMADVTHGAVRACTNVPALKAWLKGEDVTLLDTDDESLAKKNIEDILNRDDISGPVRRALELRREGGKSSVSKLKAMKLRMTEDLRVKGNFVFHGASTGRYAGAGIQVQNLPKKTVKDWDASRNNIQACTMEDLSRMLRGALVAEPGCTLVWADYAAIEARGVAWLAGAKELVQQFAEGAKIYENMAAVVYGVSPDEIKNPSDERQLGKTVVLGGGYGMGPSKFQATCEAQGLLVSADLAERAVMSYRNAYPEIPRLWYNVEAAVKTAIQQPGRVQTVRSVKIVVRGKWLEAMLPSGRLLHYANPRLVVVKKPWEREVIAYDAVHSLTKKWGAEVTWGGKLVENFTQALCADLMLGAMLELEGTHELAPVLTVHDEIVCETALGNEKKKLETLVEIMCRVPDWAKGFPIAAEGKISERYGK